MSENKNVLRDCFSKKKKEIVIEEYNKQIINKMELSNLNFKGVFTEGVFTNFMYECEEEKELGESILDGVDIDDINSLFSIIDKISSLPIEKQLHFFHYIYDYVYTLEESVKNTNIEKLTYKFNDVNHVLGAIYDLSMCMHQEGDENQMRDCEKSKNIISDFEKKHNIKIIVDDIKNQLK